MHEPDSVTTTSEREVEGGQTGLDPLAMERVWAAVVRYYKLGLHPAIAMCVRHRGQVVLDRAIGHAHGNPPGATAESPKQLATPDTLYSLASGSKPLLAMAVHKLVERGELHVDDRLARYIPEFAATDKATVTIRQLLAHRAGIPSLPRAYVDLDVLTDRARLLEAMLASPMTHRPDDITAYHALSAGFMLGEVVQRITGQDLQDFVRDTITGPVGLKLRFGVDADQVHTVAHEAFTGPTPIPRLAKRLEDSLGVDLVGAVDFSNDPRFRSGVIPSGNVTGTPNDACLFMELLRRGGELEGRRVFEPQTIQRAVEDQGHRAIDRVILLPIRYSMGFMLGADRLSFFGPRSRRAFGHLGFTNVLVWCDPARELCVALLNTGKPFLTPALAAWLAIPVELARRVPISSPR